MISPAYLYLVNTLRDLSLKSTRVPPLSGQSLCFCKRGLPPSESILAELRSTSNGPTPSTSSLEVCCEFPLHPQVCLKSAVGSCPQIRDLHQMSSSGHSTPLESLRPRSHSANSEQCFRTRRLFLPTHPHMRALTAS